ncbi:MULTISPECIES: radical SAM/SPASM domain-containing protein [Priestia]|uniref:radical SAM/SPASM domain-containing protein n=1 Tax=Priestia TaxID=2800373 RepID=UPI000BFC6C05|nr:radical SAM protein [Priestia aryabhattai]PHF65992.1 radical SAM/SPASM domain-containing protein [Priestia aryabhattai]
MVKRSLNNCTNPYNIEEDKWVASRFNARGRGEDGTLVLYNSLTGALGGVPTENEGEILRILRKGIDGEISELGNNLVQAGMLVKKGTNEFKRAELLRRGIDRTDYLHLIIMPSEECNFRCVYCYETFPRDMMEHDVINGIKKLIASRIDKLSTLAISWFGGEPLLQPDIIKEITDSFLPDIEKYGINYKSNATTNGFYLTPELCKELVDRGIRTFNITLDGLEKDHDLSRVLKGGGKTFSTIINNLRELKKTDLNFKINIRNNFHPKTDIDNFVKFLSEEFAGDSRFNVFFRPVGKWGGENDESLDVCEGREANNVMLDADLKAVKHDLPVVSLNEFIQPLGSVCYAAKPNSFVIGANGTLYKCTVALESDFNKIGKIKKNGELDIDYDKFALWVLGGADEDPHCQKCFFRPSCHGAACPLVRIESGERPCPKEKESIKGVLKVLWEQHKRFPGKANEPMTVGYMD